MSSPATCRTRSSDRPGRPRSTARRRARPPTEVADLDGRLAGFADAARGARPATPRPRHAGRRRGRRRRVRAARDPGPLRRRSRCGPASTSSWRRPTSTPASPAPTSSSPARAGSTPRPAFGKTALGVARRAAGGRRRRASRSVAASSPKGSRPWRRSVPSRSRSSEQPMTVEEAMAAGVAPVERCGERLARLVGIGSVAEGLRRCAVTGPMPRAPAATQRQARAPRRASASSRIPGGRGRSASSATGPGSSPFVLDGLAGALRPARRGSAGSTRPAS